MKGSKFLSLQNFRYILRFDFFFFAMFRTMRGHRRKKKLKSNSLITGLFSKGPSETNFDMDVFSAKVKMVDLVIDLNLPMSSLD